MLFPSLFSKSPIFYPLTHEKVKATSLCKRKCKDNSNQHFHRFLFKSRGFTNSIVVDTPAPQDLYLHLPTTRLCLRERVKVLPLSSFAILTIHDEGQLRTTSPSSFLIQTKIKIGDQKLLVHRLLNLISCESLQNSTCIDSPFLPRATSVTNTNPPRRPRRRVLQRVTTRIPHTLYPNTKRKQRRLRLGARDIHDMKVILLPKDLPSGNLSQDTHRKSTMPTCLNITMRRREGESHM